MAVMNLKLALETALLAKLSELSNKFSGETLQQLDFGVYPWHGSIEISIRLAGDDFDRMSMGDWPHYNVSKIYEGKWPEAVEYCKEMRRLWETKAVTAKEFFYLVAELVKSMNVSSAIKKFRTTETFEVTLFDPDNSKSPNYCA